MGDREFMGEGGELEDVVGIDGWEGRAGAFCGCGDGFLLVRSVSGGV